MAEAGDDPRRPVLVIQSEPELRKRLCRSLGDAGFEAIPCRDGIAAARVLSGSAPALLVIDLGLPLAQSWGLLERARQLPDPPASIALGDVDEFETFTRGVQGSVVAFAAKPVQLAGFVEACHRALAEGEREKAPLVRPDRRRDSRRRLMVGVQLLDEAGTPLALGELVDLSAGGAQLTLIARYDIGARVRVAIDPSVAGTPVRFEGEVKWCRRAVAGFSYGLELVTVSDELRRQIAALLEANRAGPEEP